MLLAPARGVDSLRSFISPIWAAETGSGSKRASFVVEERLILVKVGRVVHVDKKCMLLPRKSGQNQRPNVVLLQEARCSFPSSLVGIAGHTVFAGHWTRHAFAHRRTDILDVTQLSRLGTMPRLGCASSFARHRTELELHNSLH